MRKTILIFLILFTFHKTLYAKPEVMGVERLSKRTMQMAQLHRRLINPPPRKKYRR